MGIFGSFCCVLAKDLAFDGDVAQVCHLRLAVVGRYSAVTSVCHGTLVVCTRLHTEKSMSGVACSLIFST
jgi:hypothetical protein